MTTTCREKLRLLDEYNQAGAAHWEALTTLVEPQGRDATVDLEDRCAATQEARQFLQDARVRYQRHMADHGC